MPQTITAPEQTKVDPVGPRITVSSVVDIPIADETTHCKFPYTPRNGESVGEDKRLVKDQVSTGRCNAYSFVKVVYAEGEVFACRHHATKHWDALIKNALEVYDQRSAVNATPSPSANAV